MLQIMVIAEEKKKKNPLQLSVKEIPTSKRKKMSEKDRKNTIPTAWKLGKHA